MMKKKIKIYINSFSARRGGGQTYLINLLRYCPEDSEFEITLIKSIKSNLQIDTDKIRLLNVSFPVENPFLRSLWERWYLPKLLKKNNVDILFCPGGLIGTKVPEKCKTVTMFRNMIPFDEKFHKMYPLGYMRFRHFLLKKLMLKSMENADLVIFISKYAKNLIENLSQKGIKKSSLIHHGVSDDFRFPCLEDINDDFLATPYVIYPSTIDYYKSQLELVEAYHILKTRKISLPSLLLVGDGDKVYINKVRKEIKKYGLEKDIILTGPIPYKRMPVLYSRALFVIFASKTENCPNILLEAMASGKAVLCSNLPPMPEFAEDAAKYFDPSDPFNIADKLEELLKDKELIKFLASKSVEISKNYSWINTSEKTWKELKSLILERSASI